MAADRHQERRDPWLKFFHADWQADESLQLCSLAARGLWLEMILYMHKADPYGHLIINGRAPTNDELMRRLRPKSKREFTDAMGELRANGVYSVTEGGVIVCRRMIRRAERVTSSRENGQSGGRPRAPDTPEQNPDRNLEPNNEEPRPNRTTNLEIAPEAEARSRGQKQRQSAAASSGSKRPIFRGQRFTVFEWFLERAEQILGNYCEAFDLHTWFFELDAVAVKTDQVIPTRDNGRWLEGQLVAEARRRGLKMAAPAASGDDPYAKFLKAYRCPTCHDIHEGTVAQAGQGTCLKPPAAVISK